LRVAFTGEETMIIIQETLGNEQDAAWRDRLAGGTVDLLHLDQWEAQKSRLRKATEGGAELALSLDRATQLRDGDVLHWSEADGRAVVARIALNDVMIVDLSRALSGSPADVMRTVFELGHALGNQHWPAIVKGERVFVPLTVDRKVMASVMKTHAFSDISYDFSPGVEVLPYLAPHEARRLFGGAGQASHAHPQGNANGHGEGPAHVLNHVHADGTEHAHPYTQPHEHDHASAEATA
jgi:urease accessory protein